MKTIEENFIDWESNTFGFGYGTGEEYTIPALKTFFSCIKIESDGPNTYDYRDLEEALGPTVAWLLINILCKHGIDIIEYGTSPRFAWLTDEGKALKKFLETKMVKELIELTRHDENYTVCYPDACNCGPNGYQEGVHCPNPFWKSR